MPGQRTSGPRPAVPRKDVTVLLAPSGIRVGDLVVHPVSDGTFVARPSYFGPHAPAEPRPDVFDVDGAAWLPIGCFVVRSADHLVLVDAGLGPEVQQLPDGMLLCGGQLPTALRSLGVARGDVTDVLCTHLHSDHVGWLFDRRERAGFPNATIWVGEDDVAHFVLGEGEMTPHLRAGLLRTDRLERVAAAREVAPGVVVRPAPGHTPGSVVVEIRSAGERLILLGDTITCPVQLDRPTWHSFGDVDPVLARSSREDLWYELSRRSTAGVGAHFPELRPGRVVDGTRPTWIPDELCLSR